MLGLPLFILWMRSGYHEHFGSGYHEQKFGVLRTETLIIYLKTDTSSP